jgi:hypothetical protein
MLKYIILTKLFVLSSMFICFVYGDNIQVEVVVVVCLLVMLYRVTNRQHLEDGHNRWPNHVVGYAVNNTINLLISTCTYWSHIT